MPRDDYDRRLAVVEWRVDAIERNLETAARLLDDLERRSAVDAALDRSRGVRIKRRDAILAVIATTIISPVVAVGLDELVRHVH